MDGFLTEMDITLVFRTNVKFDLLCMKCGYIVNVPLIVRNIIPLVYHRDRRSG
jgi:hypothetical protein